MFFLRVFSAKYKEKKAAAKAPPPAAVAVESGGVARLQDGGALPATFQEGTVKESPPSSVLRKSTVLPTAAVADPKPTFTLNPNAKGWIPDAPRRRTLDSTFGGADKQEVGFSDLNPAVDRADIAVGETTANISAYLPVPRAGGSGDNDKAAPIKIADPVESSGHSSKAAAADVVDMLSREKDSKQKKSYAAALLASEGAGQV